MPKMTFIDAIRDAMFQTMSADENVMVLGEDIALKGGVFLATDGLLDAFGANRVVDTPIAEISVAGLAIGASLHGMRPIAEFQFADYILPAIDQILNEAALFRYRSAGGWSCPVVFRAPFGAGIYGGFYHSQSVETLFVGAPGLKVVIPSTPYDAKGLLISAIYDPDPVVFFEHKALYRTVSEDVPDGIYHEPIGKARIHREGTHLSIITYGKMVHESMTAAESAAEDGIEAEVLDLRTLYPLDKESILATARKTGKVLIVHEDNLTGGIGGEISAIVSEFAFEYLDAPVRRLASPDVPAAAFNEELEAYFMLNPDKIYDAIADLAAY